MKKKQKRIHLAIGWLLITALAILLFPDKNIALQAEHPHLGQLSTRTIVATRFLVELFFLQLRRFDRLLLFPAACQHLREP